MNAANFLHKPEIQAVVASFQRKLPVAVQLNRTIFRLSCCCGLRCMEIMALNLGDVVTTGPQPCLRIRKTATKGWHNVSSRNPEGKDYRRGRRVPLLWWSQENLADIESWLELRIRQLGRYDADAPFVCYQRECNQGKRLLRGCTQMKWKTALRVLGDARRKELSIHSGRRTFATHMAASGHTLADVKDVLGHASIHTTDLYIKASFEDVEPAFSEDKATLKGGIRPYHLARYPRPGLYPRLSKNPSS